MSLNFYLFVLILVGVESIFFTIAVMVLCFRFVLETGVFKLLLSSAYTESRPFLPHLTHEEAGSVLGVHNKMGKDRARTGDPN